MPTHRGFSAWIEVEGRSLPEHLVAMDSYTNRVSCWIPSEEGKAFTVHWTDHGGKIETCGYITLDGYIAPGRFLYGEGTTSRGTIRTGPASERPFIFKKVLGSGMDDSTTTSKDIGTIVLRIKRVKLVAVTSPNAIQQLPEIGSSWHGMRVGFGEDQPSFEQYPSTWKVEPYDNPGQSVPSTYVSFVFRYRSLEFLRVQGIIEDLASPAAQLSSVHLQRHVENIPATSDAGNPNLDTSTIRNSSDSVYISLGSQTTKESSTQEGDNGENPVNYPGEGLIFFPFQKRA